MIRIKDCSSHMAILTKCVLATEGTVLELGSGYFSTPLLHWLCMDKNRFLLTLDDNPEWFHQAKRFQNKYHRIRMTDWKLDLKGHYSVAFIDQSTRNRAPTAIYLKDKVDYVILHDADSPHQYHYERVFPHFKYRYDYDKVRPMTIVLSNFNDLKWLT